MSDMTKIKVDENEICVTNDSEWDDLFKFCLYKKELQFECFIGDSYRLVDIEKTALTELIEALTAMRDKMI